MAVIEAPVREFLDNVEYLLEGGFTEATAILDAAHELAHEGVRLIDGYQLSRLVHRLRKEGKSHGKDESWERTRDYVQHLLRITPHICRHQIEHGSHLYRIHPEPECTPKCKEPWVRHIQVRRACCPVCFTIPSTSGQCGCS